jgi:hypothetical protein
MGLLEGIAWGIAGGVFAELLGWFKLRHQAPEDLPIHVKTAHYWIVTTCMILSGGILVVAYLRSDLKVNAIMALNVGASAPLILGTLVSQSAPISPGRID